MANTLKFRGGSTTDIASSTVSDREIVFDTDKNTLVLGSAKDYLMRYGGNSQSGNVGIGVASPSTALDVSGTVTATAFAGPITGNVTGNLTAGSGTAAAPSVSVGTSDNGLYSPGTDQVSISTNGTQAITVDSSQQVGIGTTNPLANLNISSGDVGFTPNADADELFLENTGNCGITIGCGTNQKGNIYFGEQGVGVSVGAIVYDTNSNYMAFSTAGLASERLRIDSGGNVGIGTTSPSANLDIVNTSGGVLFRAQGAGSDVLEIESVDNAIAFDTRNTTNGLRFQIQGTTQVKLLTDGKLILGSPTINTAVNNSLVTSGRIQSDATYSNTTASAANVNITSQGLLVRSTSSARYKTNVETLEDSYADAVLNARPVYFNSIASDDTTHPDWSYWGFIAEEVAEIDPRLVHYSEDDDGNLQAEGVQYDRFVPHLINLVKRQKDQIADLTARIEALENS